MSAVAATSAPSTPTESSAQRPTADDPRWLVSPWFDLLFFANVAWVAALLPFYLSDDGEPHVRFWQVYFLTTPHRWITLALVATDPDRRAGRSWLFIALAVAAAAVVGGAWAFSGAFVCLAMVDYVWNCWHFGAQHGGILRMYSRRVGHQRPRLETLAMRTLVVYTSLRLAGWTTGWTEVWPTAGSALRIVDLLALLPAGILLALEWSHRPMARAGKISYLTSVTMLYALLLLAVRDGRFGWLILSLTTAAAAFHAIEYLAVVSYYARRRRDQGTPALFQTLARQWLSVIFAFVFAMGIVAMAAESRYREFWFGLNLWAAFLHYAYDGLIWKLRRAATAEALGVSTAAALAATRRTPA